MTKPERRKLIVKMVVARKMSVKMRESWRRRKQEAQAASGNVDGDDTSGGVPETDAALDELPDSLVG